MVRGKGRDVPTPCLAPKFNLAPPPSFGLTPDATVRRKEARLPPDKEEEQGMVGRRKRMLCSPFTLDMHDVSKNVQGPSRRQT